MTTRKIGVYLIGALGSISTTVVAGSLALKKKLVPPTGMVTASEIFNDISLVPVEDLVFGGCDIRTGKDPEDIFERIAPVHPRILLDIREEILAFTDEVDRGCVRNCGEAIQKLASQTSSPELPLEAELEHIRSNLRSFRSRHNLEEIVVVNLASTEPPISPHPCHLDMDAFKKCISDNLKEHVRASTLYSYAALQEGCAYINFTPSNAALPPALIHFAEDRSLPVMGSDGKTGETLVKSALAPMFSWRNLEIMSWEGFNLLGNMDGQVLNNPGNKESKIRTKDQVLSKILGYSPHSTVNIDYVPSLDDQKTAWDFIHFRGFLGAKMSLQFIWQGYDSILAAPLVLDLVLLAELAKRRGESGLMPHLASFFKAPLGVDKHTLPEQIRMLEDYAASLKSSPSTFRKS